MGEEEKVSTSLMVGDIAGEKEDAGAPPSSADDVGGGTAVDRFLNRALGDFPPEEAAKDYDDKLNEMTWGRRVARRFSKYKWYNPSSRIHDKLAYDTKERVVEFYESKKPVLDSAWAYFEHVSLPRHFLPGEGSDARTKSFALRRNKKDLLKRAEYGEREEKTLLYDVYGTPESELGDFGMGVGIYFYTLRVLAIILFLAGCINIPNMIYFTSSEYSEEGQDQVSSWGIKGSAICTETMWVACPDCVRDDWDRGPSTYDRFAADTTNSDLTYILKNDCEVRYREGLVSWIAVVFICLSIYIMGFISRRREVSLDEAQQTTTDYSVEVENPPTDASSPDEWKEFFDQFGDPDNKEIDRVVAVTVTLDNEKLVKQLVARRRMVQNMEYLIQPGVTFDPNNLDEMPQHCFKLPWWKKWILFQSEAPKLLENIRKKEEKIEEFAKKEHFVTNVFVTFNTEAAQRKALTALSVPRIALWRNKSTRLSNEGYLFRGQHMLLVREPPEPSSVRWHNLDESFMVKITQRMISFALTIGCIAGGAVIIALSRRRGPFAAGIVIKLINQVTPLICKTINNYFESHSSDGSRQASLYVKMTLFKWTSTAIVTALILPFSNTIQDGKTFLIFSVYSIFFTDLIMTPLIQISDIWGSIQRHMLGPRAPDQKRMNLNFRGSKYEISTRYTEMTKVLFLCFFYSSIFPLGYFFAAVILFVMYWLDKFCLLRLWGPAPLIGLQIAELSRSFFFTASLVVLAMTQAYNYAGFPFDNACSTGTTVSGDYAGNHTILTGDGETISVYIDPLSLNHEFCLQDMLRYRNPRAFPPLAKFQPEGGEWMTDDQEKLTRLMGWTFITVLAGVGLVFINRILIRALRTIFFSTYKPRGEASLQTFEECRDVFGYVPQVIVGGFEFPLVACNISQLDPDLVSFEDSDREFPYDYHNLIYDVPDLAERDMVFSIVKSWMTTTTATTTSPTQGETTTTASHTQGETTTKTSPTQEETSYEFES